MFAKNVAHRLAYLTAGVAVALSSTASGAAAQTAQNYINQAAANAAVTLARRGFDIDSIKGTYPEYTTFLRSGQRQNVTVNVSTGRYVLVVGGDGYTDDLDVYFDQVNARDVTHGPTGLIEFTVYRPGSLFYQIDMLDCDVSSCGVYAALLRIGN